MTAVGLGQHGSKMTGPCSNLCRGKYFYNFTDFRQKFQWLPWTVVRTTGS